MEYQFKTNKVCLFHDVNQWDEIITKMMCSIYAPFINAKYNWVISDFSEKDIKAVAKIQHEAWKFDYKLWAYSKDSVPAVVDYIKNTMWVECNLAVSKNDSELTEWINRWFATMLGLKVNRSFYNDKLDGKLDAMDYASYKWDTWHFTNIIKYNCRGKECEDMGQEYILDSYFWKSSIYKCNIKEILKNIDMRTKYIIF